MILGYVQKVIAQWLTPADPVVTLCMSNGRWIGRSHSGVVFCSAGLLQGYRMIIDHRGCKDSVLYVVPLEGQSKAQLNGATG